jgi:hypothetical protein
VFALKGEDMRVIKCIKRIRNSPRIHKIIDKGTDIVVWTPIMLAVYVQVLGLTYVYYKDNNK